MIANQDFTFLGNKYDELFWGSVSDGTFYLCHTCKSAGKAAKLNKFDLVAHIDLALDSDTSWECAGKTCQEDGDRGKLLWSSSKTGSRTCQLEAHIIDFFD